VCLPTATKKVCKGSYQNACCDKSQTCITYSSGRIGSCGEKQCKSGTTKCPSGDNPFEGGIVCCVNAYESCSITGGMPLCNAANEREGYSMCSGTGEYSWRKRWCKDGAETCQVHPNGYPRCISTAIEGDGTTKSTSIYMVRNKDEFTLDGKAYVITPHIEFNKTINVILEKNYDSSIFRYNDHDSILEICNYSLLNGIYGKIDASGGRINMKDKITLDIPAGAVANPIKITIGEYNLSNCDIIGERDHIMGALAVLKGLNLTTNESISPVTIPQDDSIFQRIWRAFMKIFRR